MSRTRTLLVAALVLVLVAALVVVGRELWQRSHRSGLEEALDAVPAATKRLGFTDWAAVRRELGVSSDASADTLVKKSYDHDLSAASSLGDSVAGLQESFGFSPLNAVWEAYAQSDEGATMVLKLSDDFDFGALRKRLEKIGFDKPSSSTGVWNGGTDLVAGLGGNISPELQYVAVLADQHLVVTSDGAAYAGKAARVARGKAKSLGDVTSATSVTEPLDEPLAAMLWTRDFACDDLSMSRASEDDQRRAAALVRKAGGIDPVTGLVMALTSPRTLTVVAGFESADQARDNLEPRATLAVGEAVGRSGSFSDDYRLTTSRTDGSRVLLRLKPRSGNEFPLSSLDNGPVLFASC